MWGLCTNLFKEAKNTTTRCPQKRMHFAKYPNFAAEEGTKLGEYVEYMSALKAVCIKDKADKLYFKKKLHC